MKIKLTSQKYRVAAIVKKTKAQGYSQLKVGDEISFSCNFVRTTGASRGNYALGVGVWRDGECIAGSSQNELFTRLACFELTPLSEDA